MTTETVEEAYARLHGGHAPPANTEQTTVASPAQVASTDQTAPISDEEQRKADIERFNKGVSNYGTLNYLGSLDAEENNNFLNRLTTKATDNALGMVGGAYAGEKFRKHVIPESHKYDPSITQIENKELPKGLTNLGQFHEQTMNDMESRNDLRNQHLEQAADLEREARIKEMYLQQTDKELADARERYLKSHSLEPEHFMTPQPNSTQSAPTPVQNSQLVKTPLGGSATAEYAQKFGATPEEAQRVASMSQMQKQNIPAQTQALERIQAISPNVAMTKESPLLLTPEAQKFVEERKLAQMEEQAKVQALEEQRKAEHAAAVKKVAKERFEAEQRLKHLEEQRKHHAKEHEKATQKHEEHMRRTPQPAMPTKEQTESLHAQDSLVDEMKNKVNEYYNKYGSYAKPFVKIGTKILPRFVPFYGSAMALPQAAAAKAEAEKGNRLKSTIYGMGSLGATAQASGNPLAMGIGDVMQLPAAVLGTYDILSGND